LTVASLHTIMQSTPLTRPMPAIEAGAGRAVCAVAVRVEAQRRQGRQFQKGCAGVQQHLHAFAWQQLAASGMALAGHLAAAFGDFRELHPQVVDHGAHGSGVGLEVGGSGVEFAFQNGHVHPLVVALHHGARVQA
jgi:hypothetical protein